MEQIFNTARQKIDKLLATTNTPTWVRGVILSPNHITVLEMIIADLQNDVTTYIVNKALEGAKESEQAKKEFVRLILEKKIVVKE